MADIAPLTPLRYNLSKLPAGLGDVIAPPYDVINDTQRAALCAKHADNVVKLILPEGDGDAKYANAAKQLGGMIEREVLVRDDTPAYYVYEQSFVPMFAAGEKKRVTRRGFLGLVRTVPFSDRVVLPHERTLSGPKEDRLKLFRATKTNLSPGFMLYRDPEGVVDAALVGGEEVARFNTDDGVEHVLRKVSDPVALKKVTEHVKGSSLLIADGHHRYETSLRYAQEITEQNTNAGERAAHKFFMVFFANGDDPNLVVFATHRHIHSLPSFDEAKTLAALEGLFAVRALPAGASADTIMNELAASGATAPSFAMCLPNGGAYLLSLRAGADLAQHPVLGSVTKELRNTDVAILHGAVLEHVLGINKEAQAAKTNIYYPQDPSAVLGELRGGKGQVLFLMNPTPVAHVREVAEAGEVMPQKSTFFFPKVMTGLCIHTLEPTRQVASV
jgi:uncharacterized protein (DUF1015 family)